MRESVGAAAHAPFVEVSVWPAAATPAIAGSVVATGAGVGPAGGTGAAVTTRDGAETAVVEPVASVAVTTARSVAPASSGASE